MHMRFNFLGIYNVFFVHFSNLFSMSFSVPKLGTSLPKLRLLESYLGVKLAQHFYSTLHLDEQLCYRNLLLKRLIHYGFVTALLTVCGSGLLFVRRQWQCCSESNINVVCQLLHFTGMPLPIVHQHARWYIIM